MASAAIPVRINGVAFDNVRPSATGDPKAPLRSEAYAAAGFTPETSITTAPTNKLAMSARTGGKTASRSVFCSRFMT